MEQLLVHLVGDYILQNNWMATKKTEHTQEGWLACFLHVVLYTLPFLLLTDSFLALFVIFTSHLIIDKYRLAVSWVKLWNWNWNSENFGFPEHMPFALSVWLMIIIDNVFHLLINYFALTYL